MPAIEHPDYLALDDAALLAQCDVHIYKSSGPGGQHRNKVSSAVRLRHRPSGVSAHGDDSRSQHTNKLLAIKRLRMNIACSLRRPVDVQRFASEGAAAIPPVVRECMFVPRGLAPKRGLAPNRVVGGEVPVPGVTADNRVPAPPMRLEVGQRDFRFWRVAAFLLDVLDACGGRISDAAALLGITTGNFSELLTGERHLLTAANDIRKAHGHSLLK